jgi:hypothetical protein
MLEKVLINRAGIAKYKQISKTVHDDKLNDVIRQVQIDELRPLLGERLFNDLMQNTENYNDLMEGGTYEYRGITYTNYGLEAVLAYYVYAYYTMFGSVTDTPFSMVNKINPGQSEPIDYSFKKNMFTTNKNSAFNIWNNVRLYLIRTENPLFRACDVVKNNFKIRKIG